MDNFKTFTPVYTGWIKLVMRVFGVQISKYNHKRTRVNCAKCDTEMSINTP